MNKSIIVLLEQCTCTNNERSVHTKDNDQQ